MKNLVLFLFLFGLVSCVDHNVVEQNTFKTTPKPTVQIKYAEGFSVYQSNPDFTLIITNSNTSRFNFVDSIYMPHNDNFNVNGRKVVKDYHAFALQSSTYMAYLKVLNRLDLVKGLSGVQYVNSEEYKSILKGNNTKEISLDGAIQMESLLGVKPDLFLIYPFELDNQSKYEEKGIETLLISEYLESTPLARLEWIKLFGLLLNDTKKANTFFSEVEKDYTVNTIPVDASKTVFFNLPYKDNWAMPASNSITANLVKDAGYNYIYSDQSNDNTERPKEQVWNDAMRCEYWVIIANRPSDFSLADLKAEDPIYANFPAVKNGNVIFCNTATTDYFTNGILEPQIMLKELIGASKKMQNQQTKYFKKLE